MRASFRWAPLWTQVCCQIAPEALSKAHKGPAPLPLPFLWPTAAPSKCQHLFSIKRGIVSVKKKLLSNRSPLNTWKETSPPLFEWLRPTAGENGSEAFSAYYGYQIVKPVLKHLWIYATTLSRGIRVAFKEKRLPHISQNQSALDSLEIDTQGQNWQFTVVQTLRPC